jgi:hypothetical protein
MIGPPLPLFDQAQAPFGDRTTVCHAANRYANVLGHKSVSVPMARAKAADALTAYQGAEMLARVLRVIVWLHVGAVHWRELAPAAT